MDENPAPHVMPYPSEVYIPPDVRFRLEVRAAELGLFNASGQPELEFLLEHHYGSLKRRGMADAEAFRAMGSPADPDVALLHNAMQRGKEERLQSWRGPPVKAHLPPDITARLVERAEAENCVDLTRFADILLLKRTGGLKPSVADVQAFVDDGSYPDVQALVRALFYGEPIEAREAKH